MNENLKKSGNNPKDYSAEGKDRKENHQQHGQNFKESYQNQTD
jgi:hypothetical protein